ncbi:MAG: response regulator [Magnetococcales bacterium]|nr:response regulator [Magnetococcales bacterium]
MSAASLTPVWAGRHPIQRLLYLLVAMALVVTLSITAFLFWWGHLHRDLEGVESGYHLDAIQYSALIHEELGAITLHQAVEQAHANDQNKHHHKDSEQDAHPPTATNHVHQDFLNHSNHIFIIQKGLNKLLKNDAKFPKQAVRHEDIKMVQEKLQRQFRQLEKVWEETGPNQPISFLNQSIRWVHPMSLTSEQLRRLHRAAHQTNLQHIAQSRQRNIGYLWGAIGTLLLLGGIIIQRLLLLIDANLIRQDEAQRQLESSARALAEGEKKYRTIIDATAEGFWLFDANDLHVIEVNDALCRMLGYQRTAILGRPPLDFIHPDNMRHIKEVAGKILSTDHRKFETIFLTKEGISLHAQVHCTTLHNEKGHPQSAFAFITDITQLKKMETSMRDAKEEAERANLAKSVFLAHMSHEIRTPLNAILGMGELLMENAENSEQRQYLNSSQKASKALLNLIGNILDFSKIEAGQLKLETIPFDLRELLEDAAHVTAFLAQDKGLLLQRKVAPAIPHWVMGDPVRIKQILINLIGNAIKFTPEGEVTLAADLTEKNSVHFTVRDTGIGIPLERQSAIFRPFSQADLTTTRRFGGAGLGLNICAKLVEQMGGRIWLESLPEEGSAFQFVLPLPLAPADRIPRKRPPFPGLNDLALLDEDRPHGSSRPSHDEAHATRQQGLTPHTPPLEILLVEDAEDNRLLIKAYLKKTAHRITMAENGLEAVKAFRAQRFDLVLMDVQMPVMDGIAATHELRRWEKEKHTIPVPIIALTAHAVKDVIQATKEAGCNGHVTKPITKQRLLELLMEYKQVYSGAERTDGALG